MGAKRASFKSSLAWFAFLLLIVACGVFGPRLVDGYACLQWVRFYAAQSWGARALEPARSAGRQAALAVRLLAPLPWAGEAARTALALGQPLEAQQPAAAITLYDQVGRALEAVRETPGRGLGLGDALAEAKRREQRMKARLAAPAPAP